MVGLENKKIQSIVLPLIGGVDFVDFWAAIKKSKEECFGLFGLFDRVMIDIPV